MGFHAFPTWVKGGFIGVDIFFVISGFLISTIILNNLERNSFSFVEFYSRRIRRIFPALLVVLIACYVLGWVVLLADEYMQLGKHIAAGAGFVSNFVFWRESGYFDNAAETKPLLHLWSLGIEEQFYIIWPLMLWVAKKLRINLLATTVGVVVISFALNIGKSGSDIVASFYSPLTRFWEISLGSLLACIVSYKKDIFASLKLKPSDGLAVWADQQIVRNCLSWLGVILIICGLIFITKEKSFPGWWALLPVLGAFFIVLAGTQAWLNRSILSQRILVWFGLISYPLYLWHWPLLSFVRIVGSEAPSREIRVALVFISITLAWLTYRLVEKPIRFGHYSKAKTITLLVLMILVGCVGYNCFKQNGLTSRAVVKMNPSINSGEDGWSNGAKMTDCGFLESEDEKQCASCIKDSRSVAKYALLGDSKAGAIWSGLVRTSNENGRWLQIYKGKGAKVKRPVSPLSDPINEGYMKAAIKEISGDPDIEVVVLAFATRSFFPNCDMFLKQIVPDDKYSGIALQRFDNAINQLIGAGKKVVILVDNPTLPDLRNCIHRITSSSFINNTFLKNRNNPECHLKLSRHFEITKRYRELLAILESRHPGKVRVFDTTKYMCDMTQGVCMSYKNGRVLYSGTDHISDYAAGLIGRDLNDFLRSF